MEAVSALYGVTMQESGISRGWQASASMPPKPRHRTPGDYSNGLLVAAGHQEETRVDH
jgi:hypothetical protein